MKHTKARHEDLFNQQNVLKDDFGEQTQNEKTAKEGENNMKNLKKRIIVALTSVVISITAFCGCNDMTEEEWDALENSDRANDAEYSEVVEVSDHGTEEAKSEAATFVVEDSEEYKALMAKLSEAESKLEDVSAKLESAQSEIANLENTNATLENANAKLETENSKKSESITELKASNTKLEAELKAESNPFAFDENGNLTCDFEYAERNARRQNADGTWYYLIQKGAKLITTDVRTCAGYSPEYLDNYFDCARNGYQIIGKAGNQYGIYSIGNGGVSYVSTTNTHGYSLVETTKQNGNGGDFATIFYNSFVYVEDKNAEYGYAVYLAGDYVAPTYKPTTQKKEEPKTEVVYVDRTNTVYVDRIVEKEVEKEVEKIVEVEKPVYITEKEYVYIPVTIPDDDDKFPEEPGIPDNNPDRDDDDKFIGEPDNNPTPGDDDDGPVDMNPENNPSEDEGFDDDNNGPEDMDSDNDIDDGPVDMNPENNPSEDEGFDDDDKDPADMDSDKGPDDMNPENNPSEDEGFGDNDKDPADMDSDKGPDDMNPENNPSEDDGFDDNDTDADSFVDGSVDDGPADQESDNNGAVDDEEFC